MKGIAHEGRQVLRESISAATSSYEVLPVQLLRIAIADGSV